jgi:hypothetical protein
MSEADWRELEQPVLQFDNVLWRRPPVVGQETVERAIKVIDECARAFLTSFDSEP